MYFRVPGIFSLSEKYIYTYSLLKLKTMKKIDRLKQLQYRQLGRKELMSITAGFGLPSCRENCRNICLSDPAVIDFDSCFNQCIQINGCTN